MIHKEVKSEIVNSNTQFMGNDLITTDAHTHTYIHTYMQLLYIEMTTLIKVQGLPCLGSTGWLVLPNKPHPQHVFNDMRQYGFGVLLSPDSFRALAYIYAMESGYTRLKSIQAHIWYSMNQLSTLWLELLLI